MKRRTKIGEVAAAALLATCLVGAPQGAQAQQGEGAQTPAARSELAQKLERARGLYDRGDWDEAVALYEEVYAEADAEDLRKADAALEAASILWEQGSYKKAKARAEEALELARALHYDQAIGRLLVTIGHIEASQGQLARARSTFKTCASLSEERSDAVFGALCRMNLSLVDRLQGRPGLSDAQMRRDIARLEGAKTPLAVGSALAKTGEMYARTGEGARAMMMLEKAQDQFAAAGSVPAQARNRLRIARVLQDQGDFARARAHIKMALGPLQKMKNRPGLVNAHGLLGKDAERRGARPEAVGHYNKALKLAEAIGNPQLRAQGHLALCEVLLEPTPSAGVEHHCAQADERFGRLGVPELQVRARIARGNLAQHQGQHQRARTYYKKALAQLEGDIADGLVDASTVASQKANLCQVEHSLKITGSLLTCREALEALDALEDASGYTEHVAVTAYVTGFTAQREGRLNQALGYFKRAAEVSMSQSPPRRVRAADALLRMGLIYGSGDKDEEALATFGRGLAILKGHEDRPDAATLVTQLHQQRVQALEAQQRWSQLQARAGELLAWATSQNDRAAQGMAYNYLARAQLKRDDRQGAIASLEAGVEVLEGVKEQQDLRQMMKKNLASLRD